jgi:hypothetical protein
LITAPPARVDVASPLPVRTLADNLWKREHIKYRKLDQLIAKGARPLQQGHSERGNRALTAPATGAIAAPTSGSLDAATPNCGRAARRAPVFKTRNSYRRKVSYGRSDVK